jgi:hypothetical protein
MDQHRFDALAKLVGSGATRRGALALLAGLGLGSLSPTGTEAAKSGKCKPACTECQTCNTGKCRRKNGKKRCKKGTCEPLPNGTACASPNGATGATCQNGTCTCPTLCNGTCVDTQSDEANCGTCGKVCGTNQVCQRGFCFPKAACPATQVGACIPAQMLCGVACGCGRSTEGNVVCVDIAVSCEAAPPCATSADCAARFACVDVTESGGCGCASPTKLCLAACLAPMPAREATAASEAIGGGVLGP